MVGQGYKHNGDKLGNSSRFLSFKITEILNRRATRLKTESIVSSLLLLSITIEIYFLYLGLSLYL